MTKLLFCLFLWHQCIWLDVIVVSDYSDSIDGNEMFVATAIADFVNRYTLTEEGIKIGVVTFSDKADLLCGLTSDKQKLDKALSSLGRREGSGGTDMKEGIKTSLNEFANNGRVSSKKILIVISDGDVNDVGGTLTVIHLVKSLYGVKICSVLINNNVAKPEFMQQISTGCYVESDYQNLKSILDKLDICI